MVAVVEASAVFHTQIQTVDDLEVGKQVAVEVGSAVIIFAKQSIGHGVCIECAEVVVFGLIAV